MPGAGGTDAGGKATRRVRKPHTRSREGCAMCRQRHKRCDAERPVCRRCRTANRECLYPDVTVPLRERRALQPEKSLLPGVQEVWAVSAVTSSRSAESQNPYSMPFASLRSAPAAGMDPFHSLSINMPLKSIPLLRYFFDVSSTFDIDVAGPYGKDGLSRTLHDQAALRSCILLAGLHYSWNTGGLSQFESTYLHHKVENVRLINERLHNASSEAFFDCFRQIATMALVEACFGNIPVAEVHLAGLLALREHRSSHRAIEWPEDRSNDDNLLDRYLLQCSSYVSGLKSLVHDVTTNDNPTGATEEEVSEDTEAAVQKLHGREAEGIDLRLKVICLLPQFLTPPPAPYDLEPKPTVVNAQIETMRALTESMVLREQATDPVQFSRVWNTVWMEGAPSRLMYIWSNGHAESSAPQSDQQRKKMPDHPEILSSWCGMHAAGSLYRNSVINFSNAGEVLSEEVLRYVSFRLERDLDDSKADVDSLRSTQSNLWFWKAFVGLFCLTYAERHGSSFGHDLLTLRARFEQHVWAWALLSGMTAWSDARKTLETVIWPTRSNKESLAQFVWVTAINWEVVVDVESD